MVQDLTRRYADRSRSFDAWCPTGVRARVGAWHVPLADLLNGITAAELIIERTAEAGPGGVPDLFAVLAQTAPAEAAALERSHSVSTT